MWQCRVVSRLKEKKTIHILIVTRILKSSRWSLQEDDLSTSIFCYIFSSWVVYVLCSLIYLDIASHTSFPVFDAELYIQYDCDRLILITDFCLKPVHANTIVFDQYLHQQATELLKNRQHHKHSCEFPALYSNMSLCTPDRDREQFNTQSPQITRDWKLLL